MDIVWLIAPEVAVTARLYCPAGVPGSGLLWLSDVPLQPVMPNRQQTHARRKPNRLIFRGLRKTNNKANVADAEPSQGLRSRRSSRKLACAAVVDTVSVAVPLFTSDDGLMEQVLSLGLPEHVRVTVPVKEPEAPMVRGVLTDPPRVTDRLAEPPLPVLTVISGALIVRTRLDETAEDQSLSPEYRRLKVWVPVESGAVAVLTLKLTLTGAFPETGDVAICVLPS